MLDIIRSFTYRRAALLLFLSCAVDAIAHGEDNHGSVVMDDENQASVTMTTGSGGSGANSPMSYFSYQKHSSTIIAHISLMVLGWCFILPVGVMFSVARSRLALPTQLLFLLINAFGLLLGVMYNNQTPDLYKNNAHHKIGWIATWVMIAEVIMGLLFAYSRKNKHLPGVSHERVAFLPVSTDDDTTPYPRHAVHQHHWSGDSGQGTERSSSSFHSQDTSSPGRVSESADEFVKPEEEVVEHAPTTTGRFFRIPFLDRFLAKRVPNLLSRRVLSIMDIIHLIIERSILILGFVAVASGGVVYGGIFRGDDIFNGLAHFIKGGIFVWYGLLTLGRWMGCFADFGWAWNIKPSRALVGKWRARVPTGEFTESFVIYLYGCTNVFLEHLAAWGDAWTAQDLEHVSISIMFFGGGLCGMLAESDRVREWVNSTAIPPPPPPNRYDPMDMDKWLPPKTQRLSLNPLPAIVILLLGLMMSSHHQSSMVSTMVHKQWGMLLVGFAIARGITYILLYLSPPSSILPSRPPSELVASFCLISGGLIFMLSNRGIVEAMEHYDLNAMFVFTVGMGFTAFVMAWEITLVSLKAWAAKKAILPLPSQRNFQFPE